MVGILDVTLLLDLAIILVAATIVCYILTWLRQPLILAYLVTGLIIGPIGLGALGWSWQGLPIGIQSMEEVLILSELGIAFLLFSVGVETDFSKLSDLKKVLVVGTLLQVFITILVTVSGTTFLGLDFNSALYLGVILAFSSTMVVVKLLSDKRHINTLHGRIMIGFLLVQDVLVIIAMPLLIDINNIFSTAFIIPVFLEGVALVLLAFLLSKFIYPKLFKFAVQSNELLFLAAVSSCFVFIYLAYILNFSIAIGAFIAGLSLSTLPYNLEVHNKIKALRDFFATIFFVTLGMQITFGFVAFPIAMVAFILAVVFLIKPLTYYLITLFSGYGGRISLTVAMSLAQVSEFSFIIASIGYAGGTGVLAQTPGLYSLIIVVIAGSMLLSPYFMNYSNAFYLFTDKFVRRYFMHLKRNELIHKKIRELEHAPTELYEHIVIVGGGTMGHAIAAALKRNHELVVVDHDSEVVSDLIHNEIHAVYGSADNEAVWDRVNLDDAKLLILAIPDVKPSLYMLLSAKKLNPKMVVFARAPSYSDALSLYENGADFVVISKVLGSNVFLKMVAEYLDTGKVSHVSKLKDEFLVYLREKAIEERRHKRWHPETVEDG